MKLFPNWLADRILYSNCCGDCFGAESFRNTTPKMENSTKRGTTIFPWSVVTLRAESSAFHLSHRDHWLKETLALNSLIVPCVPPKTFVSPNTYAYLFLDNLLPLGFSVISLSCHPTFISDPLVLFKLCWEGIHCSDHQHKTISYLVFRWRKHSCSWMHQEVSWLVGMGAVIFSLLLSPKPIISDSLLRYNCMNSSAYFTHKINFRIN